MSQLDIELRAGTEDADPAVTPALQKESDGSDALFTMYLNRTKEVDKDITESWKGDAEGMLVFTGLFSASVAALLAVTIPDIKPNPQDTSAYYLANIFSQLNGTDIPPLHNPAASFTPPTSSLWVIGLWVMSLIVSLTCAMLATLLQQWARRYLKLAYPKHGPENRACIHAFYANGVKESYLPTVVEVLPALLHISLLLFFSGLAVFLFGISHTMFGFVVVWLGLCVILYAYLTILPIRHKDSPFSSPLSTLVFFCQSTLIRLTDTLCKCVCNQGQVQRSNDGSRNLIQSAEYFALNNREPKIFYDALIRMFWSLDGDKALEQFFDGIPGLCKSNTVTNARTGFIIPNKPELSKALIALMDHTLSSNLVPEAVKLQRMIICAKVIDATPLLGPWWILHHVFFGKWQPFLRCIEFGLSVKVWDNHPDGVIVFYTQCVAAATISSVSKRERDDRWFWLASSALGSLKISYQNYLKHIDDILLANATFILRRTIQMYSLELPEKSRSNVINAASRTLGSFCKLDVSLTSPDRQHEFCDAWNDLVHLAQDGNRPCSLVLKSIRRLYIELHKGTNASPTAFSREADDKTPVLDEPMSYPKCGLARHQRVPELHIPMSVPEAATNEPPITTPPGTISSSHTQALPTPKSTSTPSSSPSPPTTAQKAPTFPQAPHPSKSYVGPQVAPAPTTSIVVGPTSSVPQSVSSDLPVPQVHLSAPEVLFASGRAPSASPLSSAPSSPGHTSTSAD